MLTFCRNRRMAPQGRPQAAAQAAAGGPRRGAPAGDAR